MKATPAKKLVRVLVVDDSALIRSIIRSALSRHPNIEVVGLAVDGVDALNKIAQLRPDIVTLDVEMPRMNGIRVLERVVGKMPVKFVMVSTLTAAGAQITFEALRKGAVDYITKPQAAGQAAMPAFARALCQKVMTAARAPGRGRNVVTGGSAVNNAPQLPPNNVKGWVVALGISCGGPQTLYEMLPAFPSDFVPIVITQHMPAQFTTTFAQHLDRRCAMRVCEAKTGQVVEHGTILIAPGDYHLLVRRRGVQLVTELNSGPLVSGHRPSADVMFESVANACGPRSVGLIMTGMGRDGANGIVTLANAGARTVAQDEATCYVYGMPKAAVATGAVHHVASLRDIPQVLARLIQGGRPASAPAR